MLRIDPFHEIVLTFELTKRYTYSVTTRAPADPEVFQDFMALIKVLDVAGEQWVAARRIRKYGQLTNLPPME
jgi:hypothetical protein